MARIMLAALLLIHGLIHLMGFAKAFKLADIHQLTQPISRSVGVLWLLTAAIFVIIVGLLAFKKDTWWMLAILAVIISQMLIFASWQDAKFGTIANVIVIVGIIIGYGIWSFNQMTNKELHALMPVRSFPSALITESNLTGLPSVVQRWLKRANIVGKERIYTVQLYQKGKMRTTPHSAWMPVEAQQYFTTDPPGFIWIADVKMMPMLHLSGRDKFVNGKGNMLIKALSLLTVADAKGAETDQGTALRYLAEIIWFPTAALNHYIHWEEIDASSAKATLTYDDRTVSGIFYFNSDSDMIAFEADRYYDRKGGATLEKWHIESTEYGERNGIRMPVASEVTWKLKEGDFTWYKLEIPNVIYNQRPSIFY